MKFPPRRSQNRKRASVDFVPASWGPDCAKLLFTSWLLKQQGGVLTQIKVRPGLQIC